MSVPAEAITRRPPIQREILSSPDTHPNPFSQAATVTLEPQPGTFAYALATATTPDAAAGQLHGFAAMLAQRNASPQMNSDAPLALRAEPSVTYGKGIVVTRKAEGTSQTSTAVIDYAENSGRSLVSKPGSDEGARKRFTENWKNGTHGCTGCGGGACESCSHATAASTSARNDTFEQEIADSPTVVSVGEKAAPPTVVDGTRQPSTSRETVVAPKHLVDAKASPIPTPANQEQQAGKINDETNTVANSQSSLVRETGEPPAKEARADTFIINSSITPTRLSPDSALKQKDIAAPTDKQHTTSTQVDQTQPATITEVLQSIAQTDNRDRITPPLLDSSKPASVKLATETAGSKDVIPLAAYYAAAPNNEKTIARGATAFTFHPPAAPLTTELDIPPTTNTETRSNQLSTRQAQENVVTKASDTSTVTSTDKPPRKIDDEILADNLPTKSRTMSSYSIAIPPSVTWGITQTTEDIARTTAADVTDLPVPPDDNQNISGTFVRQEHLEIVRQDTQTSTFTGNAAMFDVLPNSIVVGLAKQNDSQPPFIVTSFYEPNPATEIASAGDKTVATGKDTRTDFVITSEKPLIFTSSKSLLPPAVIFEGTPMIRRNSPETPNPTNEAGLVTISQELKVSVPVLDNQASTNIAAHSENSKPKRRRRRVKVSKQDLQSMIRIEPTQNKKNIHNKSNEKLSVVKHLRKPESQTFVDKRKVSLVKTKDLNKQVDKTKTVVNKASQPNFDETSEPRQVLGPKKKQHFKLVPFERKANSTSKPFELPTESSKASYRVKTPSEILRFHAEEELNNPTPSYLITLPTAILDLFVLQLFLHLANYYLANTAEHQHGATHYSTY